MHIRACLGEMQKELRGNVGKRVEARDKAKKHWD